MKASEIEFSISNYIREHNAVMNSVDMEALQAAVTLVKDHWERGSKIITCGNGGSASTASHYITDWNKMAYLASGRPFHGICLSDNPGLVTAYSNDISYDDVFAEQVKNWLAPGDLVIAISGSGNSENVVRALNYANANGGVTLAVSGYDGGRIRKIAHHNFWVPSYDMQICEDIHLSFGHLVMKALCQETIKGRA